MAAALTLVIIPCSVCRFIDIVTLAAKSFYRLLLADVESLCASITPSGQNKEEEILPLLAVVYKLHQLDTEWQDYISLG